MRFRAAVVREARSRLLEGSLVLTQVAGVLAGVVLARSLGPAGRGSLVLLLLCTQLVGWTTVLSLDKSVPVLSRTDDSDERDLYVVAVRSAMAISAVLLPLAAIGFGFVQDDPLLGVALGIGAAAAAGFEMRLSQPLADNDLQRYARLRMVQPIAYLVLTSLAVVATRSARLDIRVAVCALAAAGSMIAAFLAAGRHRWPGVAFQRSLLRPVLRFGLRAHASTVLQYMNARLDVLLVGITLQTRSVGIYAVGAAAGQALVFMGSAGVVRGLSGRSRTFDWTGMLLVGAVALVAVAVAPVAVPLVFGQEFADAVPIAQILLVGGVFGYGSASANGRLLGSARPLAAAGAQGAGISVLVVCVVLFPGSLIVVATGAAASYLVTMLVGEVLCRRSPSPAPDGTDPTTVPGTPDVMAPPLPDVIPTAPAPTPAPSPAQVQPEPRPRPARPPAGRDRSRPIPPRDPPTGPEIDRHHRPSPRISDRKRVPTTMPPMMEPGREADELELRDYLAVLNRRKLTIALTTAVVVAAALVYSFLQTPMYRASAEVLLQSENAADLLSAEGNAAGNQQTNANAVLTEIEVMRSRSVRDAVREELGYAPSVSIAQKGDTSVVSISATDTNADQAAEEVNTFASTFIELRRTSNLASLEEAIGILEEQVATIDQQIEDSENAVALLEARVQETPQDDPSYGTYVQERDQAVQDADALRLSLSSQRTTSSEKLGQLNLAVNAAQTGGGEVVSEASPPGAPFSPDPIRNVSVALVLGLLLGAGLAFLREYLDDTIRSKDDLDAVTGGADVLGLIPKVESWRNRGETQLVSLTAPKSSVAETYRGLRTSLQFIGVDRPLTVIQVTSASASEGKTTTLANLGVAFARAGNRVVMVDCDLRRPRLHSFFDLDNHVGFTSLILGEANVEDAIQEVPGVPRLAVMASGPPPPNPSELLSTRSAQTLLSSLAEYADYVLIDSPPLLPVADSVILARYVDATVLVATVDSTAKRGLRRALELLDQVDAPLVGVVLNGLEAEAAYAHGYGYGYHGSYGGPATGTPGPSGGGFLGRRRRRSSGASADEVAHAPMPVYDEDDEPGSAAQ